MSSTDCPPRDALDRWASGDLADDEADAIAEHLDTCADCEQTIADFPEAGFLACATVAAVGPRFDHELECEAFVSALQNLAPQSQSAGSVLLDNDDWVGRRIRDYQLLEPIGQGGMGTVYKARHVRLGRNVAVKLLMGKLAADADAVARFGREMEAVGQLEHPNIVRALNAGEVDGVPFLAMKLIDGVDLAELTSHGRSLDVADACEVVRQAAVGLQYAHSRGLIHRDIKPSNLMLAELPDSAIGARTSPSESPNPQAANVLLLDLGLAMFEDRGPQLTGGRAKWTAGDTQLTVAGQLMGTLDFMAPEQAEDTRAVDYRADIYSLGATLYRILTGTVPFDRARYRTPAQRLTALMTSPAPSVATLRKDLPTNLIRLVDRMLSRDPDERPTDLGEVINVLEQLAAGHHLVDLLQRERAARQSSPTTERGLDVGRFSEDFATTVTLPSNNSARTKPVPKGRRDSHRDIFRPWLMLGATAAALLLGIIWLTTDGVLTIEPDVDTSPPAAKSSPPMAIAPFDAATARSRQAAWADYLGVRAEMDVEIGEGESISFILIPPGEFLMGATEEEQRQTRNESTTDEDRSGDEGPLHPVQITTPFWLSRYEVTRGQFRRFVQETGYKTNAERNMNTRAWSGIANFPQTDDHPVVMVSKNDALAFCLWLNQRKESLVEFGLPREAQWEYACRAGTSTFWHCGESEATLAEHAWLKSNSDGKTHSVGQLKPNAFGLYDMHGNVAEKCADWFAADDYVRSPSSDPVGPMEGLLPVVRGGSWNHTALDCRSARRDNSNSASSYGRRAGFRLSAVLVEN